MPLHVHTSGEQVRTVTGSAEDDRLHADPAWHLDGAGPTSGDEPGDEQPADTDPPEESPVTLSRAAAADDLDAVAGYDRSPCGLLAPRGHLHVVLTGPDGEVEYDELFDNLITQLGDQYYGERAAGVAGAPAAVTGMQLGTSSTAPSKTGAGAAIVTLVAASLVALTGTPASSLNGSARRITYAVSWAAGVATANGINEVALVNQATGTQTAAPAANTIARALLNPVVNKASGDTLAVTWHHDLTGA